MIHYHRVLTLSWNNLKHSDFKLTPEACSFTHSAVNFRGTVHLNVVEAFEFCENINLGFGSFEETFDFLTSVDISLQDCDVKQMLKSLKFLQN